MRLGRLSNAQRMTNPNPTLSPSQSCQGDRPSAVSAQTAREGGCHFPEGWASMCVLGIQPWMWSLLWKLGSIVPLQ